MGTARLASPPPVPARVTSFARTGGELDDAVLASPFLVEPPRGASFTSVDPTWVLDAAATFGRAAPLVVEVGCGAGEQVVAAAAADPGRDHLAVEVWTDGVLAALRRATAAGVTNLRVLRADARQLFAGALAQGTVAEVWTFFPDPWRKARHRKRRLVDAAFAGDVARALRPGGRWRLATDWEDYAEQMRAVLAATPGLAPDPPLGWAPRWEGRVETRFERKAAAAGRPARDLSALRTS